jgi:hypothetical protein
LVRFSGFSTEDLRDKPIDFLFGGLNLDQITSGENYEISITRKDQPPVNLNAKINVLDKNMRWIRVQFADPGVGESETGPINGTFHS